VPAKGTGGDGQCVGEVGGFGEFWEVEHGLNRELYLLFGRSPRSRRGFLDLGGLELDDFDLGGSGGQQDHASSVGHLDNGAGVVLVGEHALDGDQIGLDPLDEFADIGMEFNEAVADRGGGLAGLGESEDPGFDDGGADRVAGDAAIAGDG